MPRRCAVAVAALMVVALSACSTTLDATRIGVPVTLASPAGAPAEGERFRVVQHPTYGLFGLAAFSRPSLDKVLARQLVGAQAIRDVKVTVKSRWSDVLLTVLTAGLIVPRTMVVEGTVVKEAPAAP